MCYGLPAFSCLWSLTVSCAPYNLAVTVWPAWASASTALSDALHMTYTVSWWHFTKSLQLCSCTYGHCVQQHMTLPCTGTLVHECSVEVCSQLRRQFQHRQLFVGGAAVQRVLTHADLVEHLLQKSAGLRAYLPFEGMNQVIYRCKPSTP